MLERFDLVSERVSAGPRNVEILRPRSAEDLIDEAAFARDERLPYWAELWPSARVLSEALAAASLRGRRVLELGCGLGLPALVAMLGGARVLATDWYPEALAFARENARRTCGRDLPTLLVDWRAPPPALMALPPFDLVVAADVLYEARNVQALGTLLPRMVCAGGEVWIADPRRPHAAALFEHLRDAGWRHGVEAITLTAHIDEAGPVVHLHRLAPPAGGRGAQIRA